MKSFNQVRFFNLFVQYSKYLSAAKNGVLASIIRVVFGWDLEHSRHGGGVRVDHVPDQLCDVLVDEDDVNVIALDEPLETLLNLAHCCV